MNSSSLPAMFLRTLDRLRSAFAPRNMAATDAPVQRNAEPLAVAAVAAAVLPVAAAQPVATVPESSLPVAMPIAQVPAEPEASESVPALRTLEEVRADLAKLREITRARHAEAETRREMSFAPTDFMDFADHPGPEQDNVASNFAPTDFLDFGTLDLRPAR